MVGSGNINYFYVFCAFLECPGDLSLAAGSAAIPQGLFNTPFVKKIHFYVTL